MDSMHEIQLQTQTCPAFNIQAWKCFSSKPCVNMGYTRATPELQQEKQGNRGCLLAHDNKGPA